MGEAIILKFSELFFPLLAAAKLFCILRTPTGTDQLHCDRLDKTPASVASALALGLFPVHQHRLIC